MWDVHPGAKLGPACYAEPTRQSHLPQVDGELQLLVPAALLLHRLSNEPELQRFLGRRLKIETPLQALWQSCTD